MEVSESHYPVTFIIMLPRYAKFVFFIAKVSPNTKRPINGFVFFVLDISISNVLCLVIEKLWKKIDTIVAKDPRVSSYSIAKEPKNPQF